MVFRYEISDLFLKFTFSCHFTIIPYVLKENIKNVTRCRDSRSAKSIETRLG